MHFKGLQPSVYSQTVDKLNEASEGEECIQIHYTDEFHWVTSATIGTVRSAKANIFDSKQTFRATLPPSLECQLAQMYSCNRDQLTVELSPVQQQIGCSDCGLFPIAFAVEVAFGRNPCVISYDQKRMRQHIHSCFEKSKLTPFPRARKTGNCSVRKCIIIKLYCIRKIPESRDNMVQCETCLSLFHFKCTSYKDTDQSQWVCDECNVEPQKKCFA